MTIDATTRTGLCLAGVTLRLGDGDDTITALDAVSLTVAPGELVAVVGPSGAGKSSLLAVAGGLTVPDQGSVTVDGSDLTAMKPAARTAHRREHIGFVFQSGNLIPALTALDQLRLIGHLNRRRTGTRDAEQLLAEVGMAGKAHRRPHQLSGGERQRIGIARALIGGPSLLLADEPTAALDRARSHEVVELLARETRRAAVATVMVTHDTDVLEHCDRVVEMVDGQLSG
ncbi:putative ABC transporter ATP-binding protein [Actinoplanes missouriensis 431]|uniref:Putative ABC transporter ATP-binding protein n=1 Tax=Actinoplanes missouriensis (strain ATCC 14538 / DSM 43046 / CBS 188.64 / JCM 3121 / NBRC 102363 / NCIMB 12654 / NRRL B-3342 / UNCC 431) TaxID=512565 RepID=I0H4Y4_ACTM4|nr:ABC transporter ATP-binding protein [Actinoplanes missouriensis]BAL88071.1 putative ABC transporter ATP-binding protein [Actinoplanes missouriensis 431]